MTEPATTTDASVPAKDKKDEEPFWKFFLKLMLAVFIFRSFLFAPFTIPSESMLPRLWNGDYLVASKWSYGFTSYSLPFDVPLIPSRIFASQPERGDVVIFRAPPTENDDYIKRVIGLPGDQVQMRDGVLFLNGDEVEKRPVADFVIPLSPNTACHPAAQEITTPEGLACRYERFEETLPGGRSYTVLDLGDSPADTTETIVVPEGQMFLMGDNRDNSLDSRFPAVPGGGIGLVDQDLLIGRARFVAFSTDGGAEWIKPWTWFSAARWGRIGEGL